MKFKEIKKQAFKAGQQDVRGFYEDNGAEEFKEAASSIYGWDESARNAGVHNIVCGLNRDDTSQYEIFWKYYSEGASQEEAEILREILEEEEQEQS